MMCKAELEVLAEKVCSQGRKSLPELSGDRNKPV